MTDHFMIKEEFCWQREEGEEDIINDEHNEEEAEELFQYISDIGEGEESNDDHAGQDVELLTMYQLPLCGVWTVEIPSGQATAWMLPYTGKWKQPVHLVILWPVGLHCVTGWWDHGNLCLIRWLLYFV